MCKRVCDCGSVSACVWGESQKGDAVDSVHIAVRVAVRVLYCRAS